MGEYVTCEEDVKRTKYKHQQDLDESLSVDKKADCKAKSKDGFKNEKHARASRYAQYLRKHDLSTSTSYEDADLLQCCNA